VVVAIILLTTTTKGNKMSVVKIIWVSSAGAEVCVEFLTLNAEELSDFQFCEMLFEQTNRYEGRLWSMIEPYLPAERSHTALSVGDMVCIDERVYRCKDFGWERIESVLQDLKI